MFRGKCRTFLKMPGHKKSVFFLNFMLCGIAKFCILIFPYRILSRFFGYRYPMTVASTLVSAQQRAQSIEIRRDIRLAAQYTPWDSSCLTQAMVAKFWCTLYNIPYFLFVGFPKNAKKPLHLETGHAWLTAGPIAITGGYAFDGHHVILSYSNHKPK